MTFNRCHMHQRFFLPAPPLLDPRPTCCIFSLRLKSSSAWARLLFPPPPFVQLSFSLSALLKYHPAILQKVWRSRHVRPNLIQPTSFSPQSSRWTPPPQSSMTPAIAELLGHYSMGGLSADLFFFFSARPLLTFTTIFTGERHLYIAPPLRSLTTR